MPSMASPVRTARNVTMSEMWAKPGATQPVPVSKRPGIRKIVLMLTVLLGGSGVAWGQSPAALRPEGITPAAAANTLAILRDEKRRTELINTLETIAKTSPAAPVVAPVAPVVAPGNAPVGASVTSPGPLTPAEMLAAGPVAATAALAPVPAVPPAVPVVTTPPVATAAAPTAPTAQAAAAPVKAATPQALAPDSIGVQLASRMSILLGAYARQLGESLQSVNDLPLLWRWLRSQADDPQARAAALDAGRILLLAVAVGLGVEWLVMRLLRGLRGTLELWSPQHDGADPSAPGTQEAEVRRRRFDRILRALKLVPYLLGRLLIDLLPVAAFIGVAEVLLGTSLVLSSQTRLIVLQAVEGYVLVRVILALTAVLASPVPPRLLSLSDWAAGSSRGGCGGSPSSASPAT